MRGCFCDCFGGFKNPLATSDRYDEPLDINVLNRCLEAVRAHEENEKNKYASFSYFLSKKILGDYFIPQFFISFSHKVVKVLNKSLKV